LTRWIVWHIISLCHYYKITSKVMSKIKCDYCDIVFNMKPSRIKKFKKHYCSTDCFYKGRRKDVMDNKETIIKRFNDGEMLKDIAEDMGIGYKRLLYYSQFWELPRRRAVSYPMVLKSITEKNKKHSDYKEKNFKDLYNKGLLSWRTVHKWASRAWKITEKPCEVCGWEEAERDMHLIIPRVLEKKNAISLCPNCHRLAHRKKINLSR